MMMRKVYTTPAYFTMLLLKFFNLLLIFLSRPYVARNRCRFGRLAGGGFLVCGLFWVVSWELVVHSTEWTTGSALFLVFGLFLAFSRGASGPLDGVDHWRGTFPGFCPVLGDFWGASGPLDRVDHWRGTFPSFWIKSL